jgi:hypothetical protein
MSKVAQFYPTKRRNKVNASKTGNTGITADPIPSSGDINITVGTGGKQVVIAVATYGDRPVVTPTRKPTPGSEESDLPINALIGGFTVIGNWEIGGEPDYVVTP